MRLHIPAWLAALFVAVLAVVASACAPSGADVGAAADAKAADQAAEAAGAAIASAAAEAVAAGPKARLAELTADGTFPLDAVFIDVLGTDDIERYQWTIERDAEQALIECMETAGFEFFIGPPLPPGPSRAELESPEFAAEQGFGVVSGFRSWVAEFDVEAQGRDLNQEYVRTLPGSEIERYFRVLDGDPPEPGQLPDADSCRQRSAGEAYGDWRRFLSVLPNYTGIGEERDTHPEWVAASAEWHECMVDRGLDYAEPDAIRSDVTHRMREAVESAYPGGNLPLAFIGGDWVIDPEVEPLLDELQEFELEAATANVECAAPLRDRFDAVELEVQQEFVDRNLATIAALLSES